MGFLKRGHASQMHWSAWICMDKGGLTDMAYVAFQKELDNNPNQRLLSNCNMRKGLHIHKELVKDWPILSR